MKLFKSISFSAFCLCLLVIGLISLIVQIEQRPAYNRTVSQLVIDKTIKYMADLVMKKKLAYPIRGINYTRMFGYSPGFFGGTFSSIHPGLDMSASNGQEVLASADGQVIGRGWSTLGGNYIVIDYDDGITMTYYHLSRFAVGWDEPVMFGEVIAYAGHTGLACRGAHLHCEVRYNGIAMNPLVWFSRMQRD